MRGVPYELVILALGLPAWICAWVIVSRIGERTRRRALAVFAGRLGFSFDPAQHVVPPRMAALPLFGRGRPKRIENVLRGAWQGVPSAVFDYTYSTRSMSVASMGTGRNPHRCTVIAAELPRALPRLLIRQGRRIPGSDHFPDGKTVCVGSAEFDARFSVKSDDPDFVYRLITPKLMARLLCIKGVNVQTAGTQAIVFREQRLMPRSIRVLLDLAAEFCACATDLPEAGNTSDG